MVPPVPSEVLGDRLPVLLVLLDRKIHKPEHTENPSCEHPGKQWPSHGVLRCFKSNVVSSCVFDSIFYTSRNATIIPPSIDSRKTEKPITERGLLMKIRRPCQDQTAQHLPTLRQRAERSSQDSPWRKACVNADGTQLRWTVRIDRGRCLVRCAILIIP